ncbi:MAG TPA: carboxypeptidase regulatory-like domain-containing protein [Gemmatimonadales bacterium]|nr:carboxypeptidase regulatory-like domain-containing protein [Gemmatimonadales bacterium]
MRLNQWLLAAIVVCCSAVRLTAQAAPAAPAAAAPTGRIAGRIIDRETGRSLQGARIQVVGQQGIIESDLDGRYRTPPLPTGMYSVRAALIGYKPVQMDSLRVADGKTVTADFALVVSPVELQEIVSETQVVAAPKTDAGLLAAQQAAPAVSDGISAEAISRSPDSDGGDVVRRITGISVFDKKFVIVRGLNERYSTTQLNGSDLPSPEPLKKVAPLDIFPANLIESIVTTKTGTPDKPGDFSGGAVEIKTKEFPEEPTFQMGLSLGTNSQTTFEPSPVAPRQGGDLLGFGQDKRRPSEEALSGPNVLSERSMESFRDVWTGHQEEAMPELGLNGNLGGHFGSADPFGYVLSFNYSAKRQFTPDKVVAFIPQLGANTGNGRVLDESVSEVEWGAIANFSWRVGASNKFGLKNIYTRTADEILASGPGYSTENNSTYISYGIGYVERDLFQTQLSGEHMLGFLGQSRFEWKGTLAYANRHEPDNRQANYVTGTTTPSLAQISIFQVRDLHDRVATGQLDLTIPINLRYPGDMALKFGGLLRDKPRTFTSGYFQATTTTSDPNVLTLAPEKAFSPENMGSSIVVQRYDNVGSDYESDDDLTAFYGMADVPVLSNVRLVGGLRVEHWRLNVFNNTRDDPEGAVLWRRPWDYLWSGNLTWGLTSAMNLRFAAFRSVARPDPRELVADRYTPVAQECDIVGDTSLVDSKILNGDVRWEYYPRSGEIFAVSGFYKHFDDPLVEVIGSGASACTQFTANGEEATNYGAELEARKTLDFLPGFLRNLSVGANATLVQSSVDLDSTRFGNAKDLPLQGQSPFILNASLIYGVPNWGTTLSVLFNYFDTRVARYGSGDPTQQSQAPPVNVLEKGRFSLDLKLQQNLGLTRLTFSGTNLTNEPVIWALDGSDWKQITRRYRTGTQWKIGMSYDIY